MPCCAQSRLGFASESSRPPPSLTSDASTSLPGRLKAEVVVDAAIGQPHPSAEGVGRVLSGGRGIERPGGLDRVRRQDRREGARGGDGIRDPRCGATPQPDGVVPLIRSREAEQLARLDVRRIDDEAWSLPLGREVPQRGAVKQLAVVGSRHVLGHRASGHEQATQDGCLVDRPPGHPAQRVDDEDRQPSRDGVRPEVEVAPGEAEHGGGDGPARDAGDAVEVAQEPRLVQPDETANVEEHGAVAAPGEAKGRAGPRVTELAGVVDRLRDWPCECRFVGHVDPLRPVSRRGTGVSPERADSAAAPGPTGQTAKASRNRWSARSLSPDAKASRPTVPV